MSIVTDPDGVVSGLDAWADILPPGSLRDALVDASQSIATGEVGAAAIDALHMLELFIAEMTG
jgi:hypothetical protein